MNDIESEIDDVFLWEVEFPLEGTIFSEHKEKIQRALFRNNGYCPCVSEKSKNTKCPCLEYRTTLNCHCNLYIKE